MDTTGGSSALSPAAVGGRRRGRSGKLRLVTKKVARRHLKKMGMKLRGGDPNAPVAVDPKTNLPPASGGGVDGVDETGGRRRRRGRSGKKSTKRRGRSLRRMFGL